MRNRVIVAAGIAAALVGFYFLGYYVSKFFMDFLITLIIFCSVNEMRMALKDKMPREFNPLLIIYSLTIGLPYLKLGFMGVVYYTLLIFSLGATLAVFKNIHLDGLMNFAFILIYPGLTLSSLFFVNNSQLANLGLAFVFLVSSLTDVFALVFGMLFGKRKLAPEISPKKTIEGAAGGLFGGIVGALLVFLVFEIFGWLGTGFFAWGLRKSYTYLSYALIAIFGSCLTQIGDLVASLIKRSLGIKDFSRLLGSHGGMLDRVDGMMLNACFVSLIFTFIV